MTNDAIAIRILNDRLRCEHDFSLGRWVVTRGVNDKGLLFVQRACRAVKEFTAFNRDNDPHGEHDAAFVEVDGERVMFKIDVFADQKFQHGSEHPGDPQRSYRILTVLLAEEY